MVDFLLVHDAGQGSWCWGKIWGHLTAPVEHPPRLYASGNVGKVVAMDLPGHGPRGEGNPRHILTTSVKEDRSSLSLEDFVSAVASQVQSQGLHDLVMAGHGIAAPILLQAAAKLEEPPRGIVLFAGLIPGEGKSPLEMLPRVHRLGFKMMARLNGVLRKEFKLPEAVIRHVYCNGMEPFDRIQIVGRFAPLPFRLFQTRLYLNDLAPNCPITYVPLWRDRLIPSQVQRWMANRLPGVELADELDSCHEVMIERPKQVADILTRYA